MINKNCTKSEATYVFIYLSAYVCLNIKGQYVNFFIISLRQRRTKFVGDVQRDIIKIHILSLDIQADMKIIYMITICFIASDFVQFLFINRKRVDDLRKNQFKSKLILD